MNDIESILFYITFFFISTFFYKLYNKSNSKIFLVLSFSIPMLIGGLRYKVGTDYELYLMLYNNNSKVDWGFQIINYIAKLFNNPQILFFIYNFLTLFFVFKGMKNIKQSYRSLAYFCFLFIFYTSSFNIMRQMLAVSIIFYAYKYIDEKNFKKYCFWVFIATCFHNTAALCLLLYFLINTKNKKIVFWYMLILIFIVLNYESLIILLGKIPFLSKFVRYQEYTGKQSFNNYSFYFEFIVTIYMLIFYKRLINKNQSNQNYIFMAIISLILMFTGFSNPAVKRIANYFKMSHIILLAQIPYIPKKNNDKVLNLIVVFTYSVGSFILYTFILKQADIIPYNFGKFIR